VHPAIRSARPIVFAHRGGGKIGPENTMAAFDRGLAAGADGLELDVRLSRDGIAVVHHDPTLDRTTRAKGPLKDRTAAELADVDVPALRDVLARYPKTGIIIELKEPGSALAATVVGEVRRAGAIDRVCLGSLSLSALRTARAAAPDLMTSGARFEVRMALYKSWCGLSPGRVPYQAFQVPETSGATRVVTPRFVQLAHKAGIAVHVWTVDEPEDIRRLLDWGVDGIISDRPDVAAEVVRDWVSGQSSGDSRQSSVGSHQSTVDSR
jgi:glycerophosphoryl diester phosphodiesterase